MSIRKFKKGDYIIINFNPGENYFLDRTIKHFKCKGQIKEGPINFINNYYYFVIFDEKDFMTLYKTYTDFMIKEDYTMIMQEKFLTFDLIRHLLEGKE